MQFTTFDENLQSLVAWFNYGLERFSPTVTYCWKDGIHYIRAMKVVNRMIVLVDDNSIELGPFEADEPIIFQADPDVRKSADNWSALAKVH